MAKDKGIEAKLDAVSVNSAWARLSREMPQYEVPAMGELYNGFGLAGDPIIATTLSEVAMAKQQISKYQTDMSKYQQEVGKGKKDAKKPADFQLDPVLARALNVFQQAQDIYSNKFLAGYVGSTVAEAVNFASAPGQKYPARIAELFEDYSDTRVADLSDEGEEGITKTAVMTLIPQVTQAQLLPQLIYKITNSRLESLVSKPEKAGEEAEEEED